MKKFRTKCPKKSKFFFIICFLFFIIGFISVFSFCIEPEKIIAYIKMTHFKDQDNQLLPYLITKTFGDNNETKALYIPDTKNYENKSDAIIYLYNTHQNEEYYIDLLMEHDITPSVMTSSYILREKLNNGGLKTMVETKDIKKTLEENNLNYQSSYIISRKFLEDAKLKHPTLKYFFDIHRDSVSYNNSITTYENKVYAKTLFVIGIEHDKYQENEALATKISDEMNMLVPDISKGILQKGGDQNNGIYNQDFSPNTLLIEIGSNTNNIMEINNTIEILSKSIIKVVSENGN